MKVIIPLLILGLLGSVYSQTCTLGNQQTFAKSVTPASVNLVVQSQNAAYDNFQVVWARSLTGTLDVSVNICSDTASDINLFNSDYLLNNALGVVITLTQGAVLTGVPGGTSSTSGGSFGTTTSNSTTTSRLTSSTGTSTGTGGTGSTTGAVSAGSALTPNSLLFVALASLFILPKKRLSIAILVLAVVLFMGSPNTAIAGPTATRTVIVTISVPDSMMNFCVSGSCFQRASNVTDYFSLFGQRYSTIDGIATKCNNSLVYALPGGWNFVYQTEPLTLISIAIGNYGNAYLIIMGLPQPGLGQGYVYKQYNVQNGFNQITPRTNYFGTGKDGYSVKDCDNKIAITQSFPIPEKTDIAGEPIITNFITFNGYDYAVPANSAYAPVATNACPTYSLFANANSAWQVAPSDNASLIAIKNTDGYIFATDCFTFSDNTAITSLYQPELCANRRYYTIPYTPSGGVAGNIYVTPNCSATLIRRVSSAANTYPSNIPITNYFTNANGSVFASMTNVDSLDGSSSDAVRCQPHFQSVPTGWRLTTPAELTQFVDFYQRKQWPNTDCWATSGGFTRNHLFAPCAGVTNAEKTVAGVTYYANVQGCANFLLIKL